jgi:pimeloyl-[acyl-carrier protein] methyl ester esterase
MRAVLLPGLDATGLLFTAFADQLQPEFQTSIVDYPTHVRLDYAALEARFDLPSEPFILIAESFSGPLAIRLAASKPPHLQGLVLAASFARCPSKLLKLFAPLLRPQMFRMAPPDALLRWALLGADAQVLDLGALRQAIMRVAPDVLAARLRAIAAVDVTAEFMQLRLPTLYIAGSSDRLVRNAVATDLQRAKPDLEIAILNAPHMVLQRRPAEAAAAVLHWRRART